MQTLTLKIEDVNTVRAIEELARQVNKQPEEYLHDLIRTDILAARPFSEILEPFRESFQRGGLSEEEFDQLIEEELQVVRRERREQTREQTKDDQ
ncbi:MAG: hypothetical protein AB7U82_03535 [Blastocatellales bacterium]